MASMFDASRYLTKLKGKDYLEVKWRLLWLRTDHPDAVIATEMVRFEEGMALFKAKVSIPNGGEATGWGSETSQDFGDYFEKAETKALGRALAALGFGTQFCEDHSFGTDDTGRPVDHPGSRRDLPKPTNAVPSAPPAEGGHWCVVHNVAFKEYTKGNSHWYAHPTGDGKFCNEERSVNKQTGEIAEPPAGAKAQPAALCSEAQIKAIYTIAEKEHERRDEEVEEVCHNLYGVKVTALTKSQASEFIDRLKASQIEWPGGGPIFPETASTPARLVKEISAYASHLSIAMRELDGLSEKEDGVAHWGEASEPWLQRLKERLETRLRNKKIDPQAVLAAANL